jgi:hypothetical protein
MSVDPKDDPTSLGAILVSMGTITDEDLSEAVEMLQRSSIERQIGNQLVVLDKCSTEQVDIALAAQEKMRSGKHGQAVAVVDIALARKKCTNEARRGLIKQGEEMARRTASAGGHHSVLASPMLAKPSSD